MTNPRIVKKTSLFTHYCNLEEQSKHFCGNQAFQILFATSPRY